jgi:hypothetical protein
MVITEADRYSTDWRRQQEYFIRFPPINTVYKELPEEHPLRLMRRKTDKPEPPVVVVDISTKTPEPT